VLPLERRAPPVVMKWGKVIQRRVDAEPEWAPFYVNYKKLKAVVRDVAAAAAAGGVVGGATDEGLLSLVAVAADGTIDDVPGMFGWRRVKAGGGE